MPQHPVPVGKRIEVGLECKSFWPLAYLKMSLVVGLEIGK